MFAVSCKPKKQAIAVSRLNCAGVSPRYPMIAGSFGGAPPSEEAIRSTATAKKSGAITSEKFTTQSAKRPSP